VTQRFASLDAWLAWQERLHPSTIDLGLDRVERVRRALMLRPFGCPVIIVGGTNGKGSCVALLESILAAQGLKVGTFTSPHLIRYNERIHVGGREVTDGELMDAFERITHARADVSLTFFEYNALAAFCVFADAALDAIVLEVGLGGRLDAVNVIDADAALLVSVGIDHVDWLGTTLESIGREKAGIFRHGRPAVLGSAEMPRSVREVAQAIGASLIEPGRDFRYSQSGGLWSWQGRAAMHEQLPPPALAGAQQLDNAAAVLAVLESLGDRLAVTRAAIVRGLEAVRLPGRFQRIVLGGVEWILDVAHNADAAQALARNLRDAPGSGRTLAVFGVLKDKDARAIVNALQACVDEWLLVDLPGERGMTGGELAQRAFAQNRAGVDAAGSLTGALEKARAAARPGDRIAVFGSFHVVGPALEWLQLYSRAP
jgi:dihydrofolate synthase/folylpolyglutamate synthase